MAAVQFRQEQRENVRGQRWNNPEPQRTGQQRTIFHTTHQVMRGAEDRAGAPRDFNTGLGKRGSAVTPRHQLYSELVFEFADLHGKSWLTYRTLFRRPTEAPMSGQCVEVAKLSKSQHAIAISPGAISSNSTHSMRATLTRFVARNEGH